MATKVTSPPSSGHLMSKVKRLTYRGEGQRIRLSLAVLIIWILSCIPVSAQKKVM